MIAKINGTLFYTPSCNGLEYRIKPTSNRELPAFTVILKSLKMCKVWSIH